MSDNDIFRAALHIFSFLSIVKSDFISGFEESFVGHFFVPLNSPFQDYQFS